MPQGNGICKTCGAHAGGKKVYCSSCLLERRRACVRECHLKRRYGVTPDTHNELLKSQGGVCPITQEPLNSYGCAGKTCTVDHCHTTGKVRGLLSHEANTALGLLKENIGHFERAIEYIKKHEQKVTK